MLLRKVGTVSNILRRINVVGARQTSIGFETEVPAMIGKQWLRGIGWMLAIALLAFGAFGSASAQTPAKTKVVVQVSDDDPARWNLALNNVRNLQTDLGAANVDIELVSYGPGIGMLLATSSVAPRVEEALSAGVKVVACENTMKGRKLARKDMLDGIGYVPAGVTELVQKQAQGYAYLRP
jgi:intracellular sulfur oxidation DsrE/DsrF family protein